MKVKCDFVTNSSSCSFVAWGIQTDESSLKRRLKKEFDEYKTEHGLTETEDDEYDECEEVLTEFLHEHFNKYDLTVQRRFDYDDILIGKLVSKMKDDETLREFKTKVLDSLKESGLVIKELSYIEESWMDA